MTISKAEFTSTAVNVFHPAELYRATCKAVKAAGYSPAHSRRLAAELEAGPTDARLAAILWNASTWAGTDPESWLPAEELEPEDYLAVYEDDQDWAEDEDFTPIVFEAVAGDCVALADCMADDDAAILADELADDGGEYIWTVEDWA